MQQQITDLSSKVAALASLQAANHAQNRGDIHALRNGQQSVLDALTAGLDKIADKIDRRTTSIEESVDKRFVPLEKTVKVMELRWAKATGYAIGVTALGALVFKIVEALFGHVVK